MIKKTLSLAFLFWVCCQLSIGKQSADCSLTGADLFEEMVRVNSEWLHHSDLIPFLGTPFDHLCEENLLKTHLLNVERELRFRPPAGMTAAQLQRREHHLKVLRDYWQAGAFPNNHNLPERTPFFVGTNGNICAVGHLMWMDGQEDVVNLIHDQINNAYVEEIPYPQLKEWAAHNGFTVQELAWIQPGYIWGGVYETRLNYRHLGGNIYRFTMEKTSDCLQYQHLHADTNSVAFAGVGSSCGGPAPVSPWVLEDTTDLFLGCTPNLSICNGGYLPELKKIRWHKDYDFSGLSCSEWDISFQDFPRANPYGGGAQAIFMDGMKLNTQLPGGNSSPVFYHDNYYQLAVDSSINISVAAFDPDGDSLVYKLDTCQATPMAASIYPFGTDPGNIFGNGWSYALDSLSGIFTIWNNGGNPGYALFCVRVFEYRNGTLIGETVHDNLLQINPALGGIPKISNPSNLSGANWNGKFIESCYRIEICFDLSAMETDSGQIASLTTEFLPASASFRNPITNQVVDTVFGAPATGRFCWQPPAPGWYNIPFTSRDNGCNQNFISQSSVLIHVRDTMLLAGVSTSPAGCAGVDISANIPSGAASWTWSGQFINPSNDSSVTVQYPGPGNYHYQWEVFDQNGCISRYKGTNSIQNTGQPGYNVVSAQTGCKDVQLWVVPGGPSAGWSYQWSGTGGISGSASVNDSIISHTFPGFGTYQWEVVVTDSSGCSVHQFNELVIPDNTPRFTVGEQISCETAFLTVIPDPGTGPATYLWSGAGGLGSNPGRYAAALQHQYPAPGNYPYTITVRDALGCDSTYSGMVNIPGTIPTVSISGDTLFASQGLAFQWFLNGNVIAGANQSWHVPLTPGQYSVSVTDSAGCSWESDPYTVLLTSLEGAISTNMKVYPQPAHRNLLIEIPGNLRAQKLELINLQGKVMGDWEIENRLEISVAGFPGGIYFLKLEREGVSEIKKCIIRH